MGGRLSSACEPDLDSICVPVGVYSTEDLPVGVRLRFQRPSLLRMDPYQTEVAQSFSVVSYAELVLPWRICVVLVVFRLFRGILRVRPLCLLGVFCIIRMGGFFSCRSFSAPFDGWSTGFSGLRCSACGGRDGPRGLSLLVGVGCGRICECDSPLEVSFGLLLLGSLAGMVGGGL